MNYLEFITMLMQIEGLTTRSFEEKLQNIYKITFSNKEAFYRGDVFEDNITYDGKLDFLVQRLDNLLNSDIDEIIYTNIHLEYDTELPLAFRLYYFLSIACRRENNYTLWIEIRNKYEDFFTNEVNEEISLIVQHINNVFYLSTDIPMKLVSDVFASSKKVYLLNPSNSGYLHCYADITVSIIENVRLGIYHNLDTSDFEEVLPDIKNKLETVINIQTEKYAKYYSTFARILGLLGDTEKSNEYFLMAISYEDSSKKDYNSRILYYRTKLFNHTVIRQNILSMNIMNKKIEASSKKLEANISDVKSKQETALDESVVKMSNKMNTIENDVKEKIDDSLVKNLEFIGLFSGIIGFLIASINITTNYNIYEALWLILAMFVGYSATFAIMHFIITGSRRKQRKALKDNNNKPTTSNDTNHKKK